MRLSKSLAQSVTWCLETREAVHAATWSPASGGCLTTLHDRGNEDEDGIPDYDVVQRATSLEELRAGVVKPWRDRRVFGAPVCRECEKDVDSEEELREIARGGW